MVTVHSLTKQPPPSSPLVDLFISISPKPAGLAHTSEVCVFDRRGSQT